jgi:ABC-type nitrate/sulfonate/bicarbonate transport system substrate-binding protein
MTSRREFLRRATGLGVVALMQACAPTPPAAPTAAPQPTAAPKPAASPATQAQAAPATTSRTFKIGYLTLGWAGIELIDQLGLLKQRGWNVEWQQVGPISGLVNAFSSGQADLIDMSVIIAGQMVEQGVKLSIFGTGVGTLGAVLVGKDSSIKSVPELKGKKVGGIPGGTTTQDINASIRKVFNFDVFSDTQFVQGTAPPDIANLLTKGDVESVLIWEPTTSQLTQAGTGQILATQQQLWEQASGSKETEVHVVYLTTPQIAHDFPNLLQDINQAQAQVAELWKKKDPKAVQGMMDVTKLPQDVVETAFGRTTPLSGLRDEQVSLIIEQLKFNRQYGTILQSDVWNDAAKVKSEMFVNVG